MLLFAIQGVLLLYSLFMSPFKILKKPFVLVDRNSKTSPRAYAGEQCVHEFGNRVITGCSSMSLAIGINFSGYMWKRLISTQIVFSALTLSLFKLQLDDRLAWFGLHEPTRQRNRTVSVASSDSHHQDGLGSSPVDARTTVGDTYPVRAVELVDTTDIVEAQLPNEEHLTRQQQMIQCLYDALFLVSTDQLRSLCQRTATLSSSSSSLLAEPHTAVDSSAVWTVLEVSAPFSHHDDNGDRCCCSHEHAFKPSHLMIVRIYRRTSSCPVYVKALSV